MTTEAQPRLYAGLSHVTYDGEPFDLGHSIILVRPRTFYRRWREFSGFDQGDRLVMSPDFVSVIGTLLPIALCGRSSL